jgi:predicted dehydrogenase
LVLSSAIANERAPLGIRVMKSGKDFMSDKPGITTLEQLAEVRKVRKKPNEFIRFCLVNVLRIRQLLKLVN